MRRHITPVRLAAAGLVLIALLVGIALLAPSDSYLFLPNRAKAVAPLLTIEGVKRAPRDDGEIFFVDVLVRRATLFERLFPGFYDGASLVSEDAINPTGLSDTARRRSSLREMDRSQEIAAAVALREGGYDVDANPAGALVEAVLPGAPAAAALQPSDVIVQANGRGVRTPGDLRRALASVEPGDEVTIGYNRGDDRRSARLETVASRQDPDQAAIGVFVTQEADIELPLNVKIDTEGIGGPSAGLPFALEILEKLGRDVDRGLDVAATGEIELDGTVAPVGGLKQKTIGAKEAGVDAFLVPAGENAAEARRYADGMRIIPVRNFQQALRSLATVSS